jgi:hypothetical protein
MNVVLRRETKKAIKRIAEVTDKYVAEGMSRKAARQRAIDEARDNPRRDIRRMAMAKRGKGGRLKVGTKKKHVRKAVRRKPRS